MVHTLREDAFDRLTPEACYWIGFLFADGSVCYRQGHKPQISVGLAARDRDHLVALRNFLGSTSAISEPTPERQACQFSVRSFQLCDRLLSLGRYDDRVDDALRASRDFWRGVTDGDGSIGSYKRSSSSIRCLSQFRLVGRRPVLEAFAAFLRMHRIDGPTVRPHKSIYCIGTTGRSAEKIIGLLYEGATAALKRKAEAAAGILAAAC
ncbi:hypothetical protein ACIBXA_19930 [Micromonospora echinaurantiaca]|uniref:hypothetical protein n=1 Tax=Micromonospora echinaurantiaca TaxID=47857 RepID=UPI0037A74FED